MQFKVFTLRFNSVVDAFDDAPVHDFIKDKQVQFLREHFFIRKETPYLAVVIIYQPANEASSTSQENSKQKSGKRDESWKALLTEADMPLFNTLRNWRNERCKMDGIPPYVICNNRQLAELVKAQPQSLNALMQIDGFGKGKTEKYGKEMLILLKPQTEEANNGKSS